MFLCWTNTEPKLDTPLEYLKVQEGGGEVKIGELKPAPSCQFYVNVLNRSMEE